MHASNATRHHRGGHPFHGWRRKPAAAQSNCKTDGWTKLAWRNGTPSPFARVEAPSAVVDGKLYLFGGFTDTLDASNEVNVYDPASDAWTRKKDMPTRLTHLNAALDGKTIWFAGGFKGKHRAGRCGSLEIRHSLGFMDRGTAVAGAARGAALSSWGAALHYFGGYKTDRDTNSADHWSLSLEEGKHWRREADLPEPRGHVKHAVLDGKIYALGGERGPNVTQIDLAPATASIPPRRNGPLSPACPTAAATSRAARSSTRAGSW